MNALQTAYLKNFNPTVSIKVTNLDGGGTVKNITEEIRSFLSTKYKVFLDEENGVIYIGKGN